MSNILWMDNDRTYLMPFITRLQFAGHSVVQAYTIGEAEHYLKDPKEKLTAGNLWDLIIIDIMMSVKGAGISDERYSAEITGKGRRAGLVFFTNNREAIANSGAAVAFLTMRDDEEVKTEAAALGVPAENLMYKMDVADTREFLQWVEKVLPRRGKNGEK